MLSLFRALIGCWHDWSKWDLCHATVSRWNGTTGEMTEQMRTCRKCGRRQTANL